jgi:hypothetical protein
MSHGQIVEKLIRINKVPFIQSHLKKNIIRIAYTKSVLNYSNIGVRVCVWIWTF